MDIVYGSRGKLDYIQGYIHETMFRIEFVHVIKRFHYIKYFFDDNYNLY